MEMSIQEVSGFYPAILSIRAAMKSYDSSDTVPMTAMIGEKDKKLLTRLIKAGTPHCKGIRQIIAHFSVKAPRFWWQEFDTYRIGVEKGSESTMHTIHKRPLTPEDFDGGEIQSEYLEKLNNLIELYNVDRKPELLIAIKRWLPEGFLQKRYISASYEALRNIYKQRLYHRLPHWKEFCTWIENLPNSWIITLGTK